MNGKQKGNRFERTIANKLSEALGMRFRRTPQSGAWEKEATSGDIVPLDENGVNAKFLLSIECKNVKAFPKLVYSWIVQSMFDASKRNKMPVVIFHINKTTKEDVIRLNKGTAIESPFPNGEDFIIMRLDDWLNVVNRKKLKRDEI